MPINKPPLALSHVQNLNTLYSPWGPNLGPFPRGPCLLSPFLPWGPSMPPAFILHLLGGQELFVRQLEECRTLLGREPPVGEESG